jgi:hypothetical protein
LVLNDFKAHTVAELDEWKRRATVSEEKYTKLKIAYDELMSKSKELSTPLVLCCRYDVVPV